MQPYFSQSARDLFPISYSCLPGNDLFVFTKAENICKQINDLEDLTIHVRIHNGFPWLRHSSAYKNHWQARVYFALVTASSVYEIHILLLAAQ